MDYKVEELKLMNMGKTRVHRQNSYLRGGLNVFDIELPMSMEEKIAFIDKMKDGVATYMLNLLEKWEKEKDSLPKDQYGHPKTVSKKAWIRRNDDREIIDIKYNIGTYYLFGTKFMKMSLTCPETEFGYSLEYTGGHIVHQWFHDLLKKLEQKEREYFRTHDPFQIKLGKLREYGDRYRITFDNIELNNIIWNREEDVSEERVDKYLAAYERLEREINLISNELKFD